MAHDKCLFVLAYYFPPYAEVSGFRTSKFVKYLPKSGWRPWVFTVDKRYYGDRILEQETGVAGNPRITRTPYVPIPGAVIMVKLLHPLLALAAIAKNRRTIDAVYMSGSPYHPFLLTPILAGLFAIPTILDFRDSWSINHGYDGRPGTRLLDRIRERVAMAMERISIRSATRVVFATSVIQQEYAKLFPEYAAKYETIPNGYDPEDLENINPIRTYTGKTLILTGKFHQYTPDAVDTLMAALAALPELHFVYAGWEQSIIQESASRFGLENRVTAYPYQSHKRALQFSAGAEIGLVATGMVNGLGTKIFEYLALRKPVVALVPHNSIISSEFGHIPGVIVSHPPHTTEKVLTALKEALSQDMRVADGALARFNRATAARSLARTLDSVV